MEIFYSAVKLFYTRKSGGPVGLAAKERFLYDL